MPVPIHGFHAPCKTLNWPGFDIFDLPALAPDNDRFGLFSFRPPVSKHRIHCKHQKTSFYACHTPFIKAYIKLCSKLYRGFCFTSDNRTNVWLAYADNPVCNGMDSVVIHVLLLFVDFIDNSKPFLLSDSEFTPVIKECLNITSVPAYILQLLLYCTAYFLLGTFL